MNVLFLQIPMIGAILHQSPKHVAIWSTGILCDMTPWLSHTQEANKWQWNLTVLKVEMAAGYWANKGFQQIYSSTSSNCETNTTATDKHCNNSWGAGAFSDYMMNYCRPRVLTSLFLFNGDKLGSRRAVARKTHLNAPFVLAIYVHRLDFKISAISTNFGSKA